MVLIVVRHGESEWNRTNKFCGWIDINLLAKGHNEARHAAELLRKGEYEPDALFTSKLTRTIQTGTIMLKELDRLWVDHVKTWKLNERHYGQWQGRDKTEVHREVGTEKYQYIRRNYHGCPPLVDGSDPSIDERYLGHAMPRGESLEMTLERVIPYYQAEIVPLLKQGRTVLVVTHGSVVRSFIKHLGGVSDDDISEINVATGVPLVFELDAEYEHGSYFYLDPELARAGAERVRNQGHS
ncbi:phosphoglycerate mutase 1 [Diutina catenulata]